MSHGASGKRDGQKWRIEELFRKRNKICTECQLNFYVKLLIFFTSLFLLTVETEVGTQRGQMKGVLSWLVCWACGAVARAFFLPWLL